MVVYFETQVNPTLEIINIFDIRKKFGALAIIVVDNTFATPVLQNPLKEGVDFVVRRGHGDVIGGVMVEIDKSFEDEFRCGYMCELGSVMSPSNAAWLFARGLKTLALRIIEHQENAKAITAYMEGEIQVKKVFYPGFGGIVSFTIAMNELKFVEALKLFTLRVSLGDVKSLVDLPFKMTHRSYDKNDIDKLNIDEGLIRFSIGLEDSADLKGVFKKCQEA